jgi:O-antigen/teichoic acid export membrane protein
VGGFARGAWDLLAAELAGAVAVTALGGLWAWRSVRDWPAPRWTRAALGSLTRFAGPVWLVAAGLQVFSVFDRLLLPVLVGREALGDYALGMSVAAAGLAAPMAVDSVLRARLPASPDDATFARGVRLVGVLAAWLCAGLTCTGRSWTVVLFGAGASGAGGFVAALGPWVIAAAVVTSCVVALTVREAAAACLRPLALATLVNLGLDLLWMPAHGVVGAVAATTVATALLAVRLAASVADRYRVDWGRWGVEVAALVGVGTAAGAVVDGVVWQSLAVNAAVLGVARGLGIRPSL